MNSKCEALQLLPCPFCGGDALYEQDRSDGPRSLRWSAGCRVETCMGYMGPTFPRRKDAAEAWNKRAAHSKGDAWKEAALFFNNCENAYDESMRLWRRA